MRLSAGHGSISRSLQGEVRKEAFLVDDAHTFQCQQWIFLDVQCGILASCRATVSQTSGVTHML